MKIGSLCHCPFNFEPVFGGGPRASQLKRNIYIDFFLVATLKNEQVIILICYLNVFRIKTNSIYAQYWSSNKWFHVTFFIVSLRSGACFIVPVCLILAESHFRALVLLCEVLYIRHHVTFISALRTALEVLPEESKFLDMTKQLWWFLRNCHSSNQVTNLPGTDCPVTSSSLKLPCVTSQTTVRGLS